MQPFVANMAALAVASLFYLWRAHHHSEIRRRQVLCKRVALLLWIIAQRIEGKQTQSAADKLS